MNACSKCGRMMIALFAIPKCERCELAPEPLKRQYDYWVVCREADLNRDRLVVAFKRYADARLVMTADTRASWVLHRCVLEPREEASLRWEAWPLDNQYGAGIEHAYVRICTPGAKPPFVHDRYPNMIIVR